MLCCVCSFVLRSVSNLWTCGGVLCGLGYWFNSLMLCFRYNIFGLSYFFVFLQFYLYPSNLSLSSSPFLSLSLHSTPLSFISFFFFLIFSPTILFPSPNSFSFAFLFYIMFCVFNFSFNFVDHVHDIFVGSRNQ